MDFFTMTALSPVGQGRTYTCEVAVDLARAFPVYVQVDGQRGARSLVIQMKPGSSARIPIQDRIADDLEALTQTLRRILARAIDLLYGSTEDHPAHDVMWAA
jgi:hypothetical protein